MGREVIKDDVKARVKGRPALHGWSMEEEVCQVPRDAVVQQVHPPVKLGSVTAARFAGVGLSGALPQRQGHATEPMDFGNVRSDLQPSLTAAALRRLRREV